MLYFLQSIDQFGAQQKLQIPSINPTQRSALGGLVTFALYGISLGYFLYQFIDWQQNNKLPKITSLQEEIGDNEKLKINGVFAEISYFKELVNQIDPFDPQNLILQPIIKSTTNYYDNMTIFNTKFSKNSSYSRQEFYTIIMEDVQIQNSYLSSLTNQYINYQLTIGYCNPKNLQDGQKCADQDLIDKFFQQDNYFQLVIFIEQFNPKNKQITKVPKYFVFDMIKTQMFQHQFVLKTGELTVDDGFLFPNSNIYTYLSDMNIITTQYDQVITKKMYGEELISILYFNLDQIKMINMVEYPKISEILADTGSIISWILSISFIVSKYNENICLQKTQKEVISMYYNDFVDFNVKKNWQGKVKSVNYKEKEYDPQKSQDILQKLDQIVIEKMNYLNLQNEVAKLQLILQEHLGLEKIKKYLDSKSKLELLFDKLCLIDVNYQNSLNQIFPQNDEQIGQNLQIQQDGLNDFQNNKDKSLEQELEDRIRIFNLKVTQNQSLKIQNQTSVSLSQLQFVPNHSQANARQKQDFNQ